MKRVTAFNLILIGCLLLNGCAGIHNSLRPSGKSSHWNLFNRNTAEKKDSKKKKGLPVENMVVIWSDTVLEKKDSPAIRGFTGQIYFHDSANQAVAAEGELVIYGFDDQTTDTGRSRKPTKKFIFSNEQLQTLARESLVGTSYSVWVPWEKVGGFQKNISLVAMLKTPEGKVINGGSSNNVLPGKKIVDDGIVALPSATRKSPTGPVTQASYSSGPSDSGTAQLAFINDNPAGGGIRSNTIALTPSMASHFSTPIQRPALPMPESKPTTGASLSPTSTFSPWHPRKNSEKETRGPNSTWSHSPEISEKSNPEQDSITTSKSETTTYRIRTSPVFGAPGAFK
jgi:hypothetical protein